MNFIDSVKKTLGSKRFWEWEGGSAIIYGIPAAIRFTTKRAYIPILNLPGSSPSPYIPSNLVEKILVNAFFPGGAGGIAGETLYSNYKGETPKGKRKYLARLGGALGECSIWSAIQFIGYLQGKIGPHGGNVFEPPEVLPFNFLLAALSVFTPDVVGIIKSKAETAYEKLSERLYSTA